MFDEIVTGEFSITKRVSGYNVLFELSALWENENQWHVACVKWHHDQPEYQMNPVRKTWVEFVDIFAKDRVQKFDNEEEAREFYTKKKGEQIV